MTCNFPDEELLSSLVDLYFIHQNPFMPLLHRHTFEKSIADGLHQTDVQFAANVLLVCAIGSGFSQDPRVSTASYDQSCSPCWLWFYQSQEMQESLLHKPTLHIIQSYCVSLHLTSCSFLSKSTSVVRTISWWEFQEPNSVGLDRRWNPASASLGRSHET